MKLSIGIVGIPIKLKENEILEEFFSLGLTDDLRLKTKRFLESKSKKERIQVEVKDLTELMGNEEKTESKEFKLIGISKKCLDELTKEFKRKIKEFDLVIVYGGVHTAAYLLYSLPGKVERFDLHSDNQELEIPFHTSYMNFVKKDKSQITKHEWTDLFDGIFDEKPEKKSRAEIFDIDVDYFSPTRYCKLTQESIEKQVERIKSKIRESRPKVIGIFETQNLIKKKDFERVTNLIWEGVKAKVNL